MSRAGVIPRIFSAAEDQVILARRAKGLNFETIGAMIGRSGRSVAGRHELLICRNAGRPTTRYTNAIAPIHEPQLPANDREHVDALIGEGGFRCLRFKPGPVYVATPEGLRRTAFTYDALLGARHG